VRNSQSEQENCGQPTLTQELAGWELIDNRGRPVAHWLRSHLPSSTSVKICVAYLSPSGFGTIKDELEHFLHGGGVLLVLSCINQSNIV